MDFIIDEAEVSDEFYSENSDCPEDESLLDDFIKRDNKCEDEIDSATFYKHFENTRKFQNQQKKTVEEIDRNEGLYFGKGGQPEMFAPENIKDINFTYAVNTIGQEKFLKLKETEKDIMLDYTQFGFFDQYMKLNDFLAQ